MKTTPHLSSVLVALALSPAFLQSSTDCGVTGDARLVVLELEADGLNRIVNFTSDDPTYDVWLDGSPTITLRAQAVESGARLSWSYGDDFGALGQGAGEATFPAVGSATSIRIWVRTPGGAAKSYDILIDPACTGSECDDGNPCTADACDLASATCSFSAANDTAICGVLEDGACAAGRCERCSPQSTGPGVLNDSYVFVNSPADIADLDGVWCLTGSLSIRGASADDLSGMELLRGVAGDVFIRETSLDSLDGLEGLRNIGGELWIHDNPLLQRIDALGGASMFGDYITIQENPVLESLEGLPVPAGLDNGLALRNCAGLTDVEALSALERSNLLTLVNLTSLTDFSGLRNVRDVGTLGIAGLSIDDLSAFAGVTRIGWLQLSNLSLTDLQGLGSASVEGLTVSSMPNLTSLVGADGLGPSLTWLMVSNNPLLTDLTGLERVTAVTDRLLIQNGPALESLSGLEQLQRVFIATIQDNPALTDMTGLNGLQQVDAEIEIRDNEALVSLAGLEALSTVVGDISLFSNALENPAGLAGLTHVGGSLWIGDGDLTSMDGLVALRTVGSLSQTGAPWLTDPGTYPALESIGTFHFSNNLRLPHCKVTALVGLHGTECDRCWGNSLTSPECVVSRDALPPVGLATHRDYGGWGVFDDFDPNPEHPQMMVERDADGNPIETARMTMEFVYTIPSGAAIMSATLALPTHASVWDQVSSFDVVAISYAGDGVITTQDALEGDELPGFGFGVGSETLTELDVTDAVSKAQEERHDYLGLVIHLDQEWRTGPILQSLETFGFDAEPLDRPRLIVEWQ
ncbi:MAG: hypothetical protein AAF436_21160 [Myxococcota bacterium]